MHTYKIAVIPGDGIGKEVVPAAIEVLDKIAELDGGFQFEWTYFPWGCDYYLEHGEMMPEDGIEILKQYDQIFLGAVGMPDLVPDHISLWGLLIKIRRGMKQSINVRPAKLLAGLESPLKNPQNFDITVVRENSEGEYSDSGGRIHQGVDEIAIQNAVFTRKGTERAMRYAFELAKNSRNHVTSATKSNGLTYSMPFWDEVFENVKKDFPEINTAVNHIDALAAFFVMKPQAFDVIVASNLFGDILTDLGGAIMGSIGIAPAANLNIEREYPSMFEPVHGSAPDIAGQGIANPIGQIWTGKMMLDFLGHHEAGARVLKAIEETLSSGIKTGDLGGTSTLLDVKNAILSHL
ncbi:tartrate dehydrogenase/decarboxylase/D-malate dehydrogenase [Lysinibacillus composti]|uniref:D-malate dehydrogenase (decarboxylating) n=1 Tax=Lysinibacillus composti TaxID=720633 RepID=A0A3N9UGF8_9BACI|nr:tartrate dehydrogenase [Lysinibacillus composti]MBM7608126.1 tartrate dehydrogenase/decarboxylase/D-malate dehydrogenase [Lysinibacillus composti]RQW75197.1 tartrate dehydrogenase [Lysinibacillus composti]